MYICFEKKINWKKKEKKRLVIYLRHCMYVEKRDACPERKKEKK